ncbi:hypothetical protein, partial [Arenibacter sp. S6351L]|uniref:hypothetical protein n=1 Tax=Arenibacter sp. S6351L TaxID=2926407 RepID=UPI001FF57153
PKKTWFLACGDLDWSTFGFPLSSVLQIRNPAAIAACSLFYSKTSNYIWLFPQKKEPRLKDVVSCLW